MKNSTQMKKKWMQFKVSALSASVAALIVNSIPTQISASDIDIYQAGGTGSIDILFMLDVSTSMYTYQFTNDYTHTSDKSVCRTGYEKNTSGSKYLTITDAGNNRGSYSRTGNSSNYKFTFVGSGSGRYNITPVNYNNNTHKNNPGNRYNEVSCIDRVPKQYCTSSSQLTSDYKVYDYIYAETGDPSCIVDYSDIADSTFQKDKDYISRINKVCEKISDNKYLCHSRLANLKKALITLVNSEETKDDMYFSLGYYPHSVPKGRFSNDLIGKIKDEVRIKMDEAGKAKFLKQVLDLSTMNGTPIANAYDTALTHFKDVDLTGTSESCIGRGLYFLTDGFPQLETSTPTEDSIILPSMSSRYWSTIGRKARELRTNKAVKTATVGFGKGYYAEGATSSKGTFSCNLLTPNSAEAQLCYLGNK